MSKFSLSGGLFRAARAARTVKAVSSGNPKKIARRGKNVAAGRAAARSKTGRKMFR